MDDKKRYSVLIIDDDRSSIIALNSILSAQYNIHVTKYGYDGVRIAEQFQPDIILLDVVMPDMDDFQVLTALKSSVITKDIPVLLITSRSDKEDEEKGLALGAIDYIRKPITSQNVRLRVGNHIRQFAAASAKAESAAENNAILCEYMAKLSLEMRTPLNGIINIASQQLYDNSLPQAHFDAYKRVYDAGNLLLGMVDEISVMSDICDKKVIGGSYEFGRVLVVDDSEMCLTAAKRIFSLYGFEVDTVSCGVEAVEMIQCGRKYDALFVDYLMPDFDGVETIKRIRELGYTMPAVALTADCAADRKEIFISSGFDDFVAKPIDIQVIEVVLKRLFTAYC